MESPSGIYRIQEPNLSEIDEKWSEMDPIKLFGAEKSGQLSGKRGERHGMGFDP